MPNPRSTPVSLVLRATLPAAMAALVLAGCGRGLPGGAEAPDAAFGALGKGSPITSYYKSITTSMSGKVLMNALTKLVAGQKEYSYDDARDKMFASVDDLDNDNVVQDVYTGRRVAGVTDRKSAFQRGMNAEHTWCQSMGAKEGPAQADLHHIFPVDAGANSSRNNLPFGEVLPGEGTMLPDFLGDGLHSRMGRGSAGKDVFEPRADHRGDVARAMFYIYIRYVNGAKNLGAFRLDNFKLEQDTLLRWAVTDPVTAAEKARNEAIYHVQGNRNPFVDHPEYIKRIGKFLSATKEF